MGERDVVHDHFTARGLGRGCVEDDRGLFSAGIGRGRNRHIQGDGKELPGFKSFDHRITPVTGDGSMRGGDPRRPLTRTGMPATGLLVTANRLPPPHAVPVCYSLIASFRVALIVRMRSRREILSSSMSCGPTPQSTSGVASTARPISFLFSVSRIPITWLGRNWTRRKSSTR